MNKTISESDLKDIREQIRCYTRDEAALKTKLANMDSETRRRADATLNNIRNEKNILLKRLFKDD